MLESKKQSEYLSKKRIVDLVYQLLYTMKKHPERWKDSPLFLKLKEKGLNLRKINNQH